MRPEPAQPDAQKMKTTRPMSRMEPNDETRPMTTPVSADEGSDMVADVCVCVCVCVRARRCAGSQDISGVAGPRASCCGVGTAAASQTRAATAASMERSFQSEDKIISVDGRHRRSGSRYRGIEQDRMSTRAGVGSCLPWVSFCSSGRWREVRYNDRWRCLRGGRGGWRKRRADSE